MKKWEYSLVWTSLKASTCRWIWESHWSLCCWLLDASAALTARYLQSLIWVFEICLRLRSCICQAVKEASLPWYSWCLNSWVHCIYGWIKGGIRGDYNSHLDVLGGIFQAIQEGRRDLHENTIVLSAVCICQQCLTIHEFQSNSNSTPQGQSTQRVLSAMRIDSYFFPLK